MAEDTDTCTDHSGGSGMGKTETEDTLTGNTGGGAEKQ